MNKNVAFLDPVALKANLFNHRSFTDKRACSNPYYGVAIGKVD